jgi:hypothetical protein
MDQGVSFGELRRLASEMESALLILEDYADISFPLVVGDLRRFPRPAAEHRAAEQGFEAPREEGKTTVAVLYAFAAAAESGRTVPRELLALVQPAIDAFRALPEMAAVPAGEEEQGTDARPEAPS